MAITYPTSLDAFSNPASADLLSTGHALQHANINDAVEALEAKLAIGNTVIGTYTAYTPSIANFTLGNGTIATQYCRVNNFVHYTGLITFGSTTAFTNTPYFSLPITGDGFADGQPVGTNYIVDVSSGIYYAGIVRSGTATQVWASIHSSDIGGWLRFRTVSATTPMTWATGDKYGFNIYYKAA